MSTPLLQDTNPLLVQTRRGEYLPRWWAVVLMTFIIPFVAGCGGFGAAAFNLLHHLSSLNELQTTTPRQLRQLALAQTPFEQTLFLVFSFGGIFLLLWLWVRRVERRPFHTLGLTSKGALRKFGRGFGIGIAMFSAAVALMALPGFVAARADPSLSARAVGGVMLVLVGWLVQGSAEELLFRGWAMPVLSARYGTRLGVFLSAVLFSILHGLNPHLSILALFNLFLFGLFMALYSLWEGSVWGVFALHAAWNWTQGNLLGFSVSGTPPLGGSLLKLYENGPDLLTGGLFGPEGGLAVTLVLGVGIAALLTRGWSEGWAGRG